MRVTQHISIPSGTPDLISTPNEFVLSAAAHVAQAWAVLAGSQSELLQFTASETKVVAATPVKRRGKSMSRRTGQSGHIESSGKWWVVRWWMDVPGQIKRRLMRGKICPISGPGSLSKSAMERRAREIITASGADTVEYFNLVLGTKLNQQEKKDLVAFMRAL